MPLLDLDAAFKRACEDGFDEVFLARMNLVGFHEAGKTSLARRLLGDKFDINEESTEGITLHYIESKFNKDTEKGESWIKSEITSDKMHRQVKEKTASELEKSKTLPKDKDDNDQKTGDIGQITSDDYQSTADKDQSSDKNKQNTSHKDEVLSDESLPITNEYVKEQKTPQPSKQSNQIHEKRHDERKVAKQQNEKQKQDRNIKSPYNITEIPASADDSASKETVPFTLRLWDLGGQNDFITTHHLFLDVEATTVIVMDITQEFDKTFRIQDRQQNKDKDLRLKHTNPKTPAHILHYWLNTFFVEAKAKVRKENMENDFKLNIAIVLTHVDHIKPEEQNQYIQQYKQKIWESFKGRPYVDKAKGIPIFEVDNMGSSDNDFQLLRDQLFENFKKQNGWGLKMPTRWMALQAKILERSEKVMKLSTLKEEASNFLFEDLEVESFLKLHNSVGNLLYFDGTTEVKDNIITDPKWLVEKCKQVITHPEFLDKRKLQTESNPGRSHQQSKKGVEMKQSGLEKEKGREIIQDLQDTLDELKRGLVTDEGLALLWKGDEVEFLTELMLSFDLFIPMTRAVESNMCYLIPCMLPNDDNCNASVLKLRVYLYDALQEAECGDWFKIGEFDKLLAAFARLPGWILCKEPYPSYGCAHFESSQQRLYVQMYLEGKKTHDEIKQEKPLFRVAMYYTKNTLKKDTQNIFWSFTHLIRELRKVKEILHDRMGVINIKQAKHFKVLCPNYDPDRDEYSTLIDAEEEEEDVIRVSEGHNRCCLEHKKPLPSDQYTWLIQNVLCEYIMIFHYFIKVYLNAKNCLKIKFSILSMTIYHVFFLKWTKRNEKKFKDLMLHYCQVKQIL